MSPTQQRFGRRRRTSRRRPRHPTPGTPTWSRRRGVRTPLLRIAGLMIRLKKLGPDPTSNYQEMLEALTEEERRERRQGIATLDRRFSVWFRDRHGLPAKAA